MSYGELWCCACEAPCLRRVPMRTGASQVLMDLGDAKTILRLRHHRVHLVRRGGDLLRRELQLRSRGLVRRLPRARRRLAVARPRGRRASRLLEFFEEGVEEERVAAEALDGADEDGGETEVLAARL